MTSKAAVGIATLIHYLLRISIFLEQPVHRCSNAPTIASWIYLVATAMVVLDIDIYPERYTNIPRFCQILVETIGSLLLIEFSTILIWCNIEKIFYKVLKCALFEKHSNMYYDMGGDALVGFLLTLASLFILMNAAMATDHYCLFKRKGLPYIKKVFDRLKSLFKIPRRDCCRITSSSCCCRQVKKCLKICPICSCPTNPSDEEIPCSVTTRRKKFRTC